MTTDNRPTTSRFHPARWTAIRGIGSVKVCEICGEQIGEITQRQMLNEIVLFADPNGCCEVLPQPKP